VIDNWKSILVPEIIDYINLIQVPDNHTSEGYAKNIKIDLKQVDPANVQLNFDPQSQGLYLEVDHIFGEFTGDFEACSLWILCVWGHFKATLKNDGASLNTKLDLTGL